MAEREIGLSEIAKYARALHCPTRWRIIEFLAHSPAATSEIASRLKRRGRGIGRPNLYYHLSALQDAGIIEVAEYREQGGGAPEKVWRLAIDKITLKLREGR
ncbi:MAG: winged helix-turn-helix domain-containing protein [Candidatus Acetothermia bacterium]|jgi:DNA-binding transcriptional ArsR family regulator|nr:winged helix-turn-helix domain-containing protein [Candidatus Acetothermia bacterium]MDH7505489.1 winged helix-turn-helix domain-containing protein [Candidatus Acetothermia bacterium]